MALLSSDTLTGCTSIPSFMGGNSDTPANPTYTIFNNTNAPPSWVKDTSHNNKALRVIGGANGTSISSGGSVAFTTVLSSGKTFSAVANQITVPGAIQANSSGFSPLPVMQASASTGSHTPSGSTMATHSHPYRRSNETSANLTSSNTAPQFTGSANAVTPGAISGLNSSGNFPHSHTVIAPHTHPFTLTQHAHPFTTTQHGHPITINENFSVRYVDVIIAKKS